MFGVSFPPVLTWEQWFGRLFEASWQGALFLLVAWVIVVSVKSLTATARCWIWRIAFLKFAFVLLFAGLIQLPVWAPEDVAQAKVMDSSSSMSTDLVSSEPDSNPAWESQVSTAESEMGPEMVRTPTKPSVGTEVSRSGSFWLGVLGCFWGIGVLVFSGHLVYQFRSAFRLARSASDVSDLHVQQLYRKVCAQLKLSTPPKLAKSKKLESPVLVGVINPTILLPASMLDSANGNELKMALAHELAHAKRKDLLWNWLFAGVRTVFFFHPLIWMTQKRVNLDQELACDQLAFTVTNATLEQYGNLLVKFSATTTPGAMNNLASVGAAGSFETLKVRILEMKKYRNPANSTSKWTSAFVVTGICLLALPVTLVAQESETERQSTQQMEKQSADKESSSAKSSASAQTRSSKQSSTTVNSSTSETSSQSANGKSRRRSANANVVNGDLAESIKVTWNTNGSIAVVFRSNESGTHKTKKYRVKSMDELEQANKRAFDFFKKHIKVDKNGVSSTTSSGIVEGQGSATRSTTGATSGDGPRTWRYRSTGEQPMKSGSGGGGFSSSSASSSSWSRSSSRSRNGDAQSNQASGSTSSSSKSGGEVDRMMIQQLEEMLKQSSNTQQREVLEKMLDQLKNKESGGN